MSLPEIAVADNFTAAKTKVNEWGNLLTSLTLGKDGRSKIQTIAIDENATKYVNALRNAASTAGLGLTIKKTDTHIEFQVKPKRAVNS